MRGHFHVYSLMRSLFAGILFCFFLFSCTASPGDDRLEGRAAALYSKSLTYRYSRPDSVLWCGRQIDSLPGLRAQEKAMAQICYGNYYNHVSKYRLAQKNYSTAIALLAESGNDTLLATAHTGLGNAKKNLGEFDDAIEEFLLALSLYEKHAHVNASGVHVNIAQVYQLKEDEQAANEHLHVALSALRHNKGNPAYLIAAHTLANLHGMAGKLDSARLLDYEGLRICDSLGQQKLKSPFLDNLALCMLDEGKCDSSRIYFKQCLLLDSAYSETKQMADTYGNLSGLAMEEKKYTEAEQYALWSLHKARETGYAIGERNAWGVLADIYAAIDSFPKALAAKDSVNIVSRRIINDKTEARIAEFEAVYDSEKQMQQIAAQEEDIMLQRIAIGAGVCILVLAAIIAALYIAALRRKKENELADRMRESELRAQAAVYASEQQERARIGRDLHDSVGQMLAVIRMQLSTQQHDHPQLKQTLEPSTALLEKTITEVRAISHNLLPEEVNLGLVAALRSLRDTVNASEQVKMELHIEDEAQLHGIPSERVLNIYRIVQEVTGNMLNHSHTEKIECSAGVADGNLLLQVRDYGIGFDSKNIRGSSGIGWKNIRARVTLLDGSMHVESAAGKGTAVTVRIAL